MLNITLNKSANKPTNNEYLIFLIPILAKYILIIYIVVSVDPCITDANLPIKVSAPCFAKISFKTTSELDPDIGLNNAKGNTSLGKFILIKKPFNRLQT